MTDNEFHDCLHYSLNRVRGSLVSIKEVAIQKQADPLIINGLLIAMGELEALENMLSRKMAIEREVKA